METANWLLSEITSIFGSAIWSFFSKGALFGLIGLIGGIVLVRGWNKRKAFSRPNKAWTFLAKINLFYIPILFSLLFGVFASVIGIQKTTNNWIKSSADSIQEYAAGYLPEVEKIGQQLIQSADKTEDALYAKVVEGSGLSKNSMGQKFYYWFNRNIISFMLSKLGYSDDVSGITQMVQEKQLTQLNASFFGGVSNNLQNNLVGNYFMAIYYGLLAIFLPFILIPIGEYVVYLLNKKAFAKKAIPTDDGNSGTV